MMARGTAWEPTIREADLSATSRMSASEGEGGLKPADGAQAAVKTEATVRVRVCVGVRMMSRASETAGVLKRGVGFNV